MIRGALRTSAFSYLFRRVYPTIMHPFTLAGFQDELAKIAAPQPSETPASKANAFFGLPLGPARKRNTRDYEGSAAAQTPDRSQSPVGGDSVANITQGAAMNPGVGPGGA